MNAVNFFEQSLRAEEMELVVIARIGTEDGEGWRTCRCGVGSIHYQKDCTTPASEEPGEEYRKAMLEMEKKGIVRRDSGDSWTVLDLERYVHEMGG